MAANKAVFVVVIFDNEDDSWASVQRDDDDEENGACKKVGRARDDDVLGESINSVEGRTSEQRNIKTASPCAALSTYAGLMVFLDLDLLFRLVAMVGRMNSCRLLVELVPHTPKFLVGGKSKRRNGCVVCVSLSTAYLKILLSTWIAPKAGPTIISQKRQSPKTGTSIGRQSTSFPSFMLEKCRI